MRYTLSLYATLACLLLLVIRPLELFGGSNASSDTSIVQVTRASGDTIAQRLDLTEKEVASLFRELEKHRILEFKSELRDEFLSWAQTRFWFASIALLIIGFFGIRGIIRELVSSELKDATKAGAAAEVAAVSAREATKKAHEKIEGLQETLTDLDSRAIEVDSRFREVLARLDAESKHVRQQSQDEIKLLTNRLDKLDELVTKTAATPSASDLVTKYQERKNELLAADRLHRSDFIKNSVYLMHVLVSNVKDDLATKIVDVLTSEGFKASVLEVPDLSSRGRVIQYASKAKEGALRARDLVSPLLSGEELPVVPYENRPKKTYSPNYFSIALAPKQDTELASDVS